MDVLEIENTIKELEEGDTTFTNCQKLASLYVVLDKLGNTDDKVEQELDDILPAYRLFVNTKRRYQLGEIQESAVLNELMLVCREIQEFINIMYVGTDMPEERHIIERTLTTLYEKYAQNP